MPARVKVCGVTNEDDARAAAGAGAWAIGMILSLASGSRPFAFLGSGNASISRIVVTGDRWIVRSYNDSAHLDELPVPV